MDVPAIVISIVSGVVLVGLVVWLIVTARQPILPKGNELSYTHKGARGSTSLIVRDTDSIVTREQAKGFAERVYAICVVWEDAGNPSGLNILSTVRVLIMPDEQFEAMARTYMLPKTVNAFQVWTPQRVGTGPALLVFRGSLTPAQHDSLVVHESLHALLGKLDGDVDASHLKASWALEKVVSDNLVDILAK